MWKESALRLGDTEGTGVCADGSFRQTKAQDERREKGGLLYLLGSKKSGRTDGFGLKTDASMHRKRLRTG